MNNIIGQKRGMLQILSVKKRKGNDYLYECKCDCGKICIKRGTYLSRKSSAIKNCGCLYFYNGKKVSKDSLYRIYRHMIQRCHLKYNDRHYKYYQGKGIIVCEEWRNNYLLFEKWSLENGYKKGLTIDRINPDGNYEPSNCRWITRSENSSRVTKKTGIICLNEEEQKEIKEKRSYGYKIQQLSKEYCVSEPTIRKVLKEDLEE